MTNYRETNENTGYFKYLKYLGKVVQFSDPGIEYLVLQDRFGHILFCDINSLVVYYYSQLFEEIESYNREIEKSYDLRWSYND